MFYNKVSIIQMEDQHQSYQNKIEISQFGIIFLRQLSQQQSDQNPLPENQKQNRSGSTLKVKRRGQGINFQKFANHTQTMIHQEINHLLRVKTEATQVTELKKKQILHHNNWLNEQKMIKHKLSDQQARMEQTKYSQYDWKKQHESMKKIKYSILSEWETINLTRQKRMKSKLKNMLNKKYPKRSQSGLISLSIKKRSK